MKAGQQVEDEPSPKATGRERPFFDTASTAIYAAIALMAFLIGAFTILEKSFLYPTLRDAHKAGKALYHQAVHFDDPLQTDAWVKARSDERGVTIHDPAGAFSGLTLYTSGHRASAFLVNMEGDVVHEWNLPFSQAWDNTASYRKPRPDGFVFMRKAKMFPNGDLLAVYVGLGDTPWGHGIVKMDKDSNIIWKYLDRAHHDIAVGPQGRIYALTHRMREQPVSRYGFLEPPVIEDFLTILSSEGTLESRISLLDAVSHSPYGRFLHTLPFYTHHDPLHTNALEVLTEETSASLPEANAGDILLSFRELGMLAIYSPEKGALIWATRGSWLGQHDPDLLPNGNILLFDNGGNMGEGGKSRVIEFNPNTLAITWSYSGTMHDSFNSVLRSAQQRLPNGNTLITESDGARLLEVNRSGETVWEYINPVRAGRNDDLAPVVTWGSRISPSDLDPSFLAAIGHN